MKSLLLFCAIFTTIFSTEPVDAVKFEVEKDGFILLGDVILEKGNVTVESLKVKAKDDFQCPYSKEYLYKTTRAFCPKKVHVHSSAHDDTDKHLILSLLFKKQDDCIHPIYKYLVYTNILKEVETFKGPKHMWEGLTLPYALSEEPQLVNGKVLIGGYTPVYQIHTWKRFNGTSYEELAVKEYKKTEFARVVQVGIVCKQCRDTRTFLDKIFRIKKPSFHDVSNAQLVGSIKITSIKETLDKPPEIEEKIVDVQLNFMPTHLFEYTRHLFSKTCPAAFGSLKPYSSADYKKSLLRKYKAEKIS